jgi:hypothetical protein
MSHPDPELLAALALGEPVTDDVREHVEGCDMCLDEVAALGATVESLRAPLPELVPPAPALRAAVLSAALGGGSGSSGAGGGTAAGADSPGGDELAARRAARSHRGDSSVTPRRFGAAWLVGAAAAGLVIGGLGVAAVEGARDPEQQTVVVAQADLDTLDTGATLGVADLVEHDGTTDLALHTDAMSADDGYLEVWLINRDGERMVSIGVLEPGRTDQTFAVPAELVAEGYVIVDISREPFDADATHSGDSLARGTLPV